MKGWSVGQRAVRLAVTEVEAAVSIRVRENVDPAAPERQHHLARATERDLSHKVGRGERTEK